MKNKITFEMLLGILCDNLSAWEGEEDSVKEEHAELIALTSEIVEQAFTERKRQ